MEIAQRLKNAPATKDFCSHQMESVSTTAAEAVEMVIVLHRKFAVVIKDIR